MQIKNLLILNKNGWLIMSIAIVTIVSSIFTIYYYHPHHFLGSPNLHKGIDKFGIKEIYPTKSGGGREWFINMDNPKDDRLFSITSNIPITRQSDGSWHVSNSLVRMNINTPLGIEPWRNVEMTGYVKVILANNMAGDNKNDSNDENNNTSITDLDWRARGGRHNISVPCEGTALNGRIYSDGRVGWKKEIWHTGGYTNTRSISKVTDSIVGRWIGWKVVMYNINNDNAVKMESYLDDKNNNHWVKVTDLIDNGGWYADSSDSVFYSANCGKSKDYIITNSGTIVTFRSDNMILDFKNLSIREIQAST